MSSKKFVIEVERLHIVMAQAFILKIGAPGAFILGKLGKQIENFLASFPTAEKFRLTAEAIAPEEKAQAVIDRESEEERSEG